MEYTRERTRGKAISLRRNSSLLLIPHSVSAHARHDRSTGRSGSQSHARAMSRLPPRDRFAYDMQPLFFTTTTSAESRVPVAALACNSALLSCPYYFIRD